ncbi:SMI1/KNR4 family protein [Brevibacillus daliensis]|uniref:SMI1/KNR4 family protein n=1 Tax=Brevibacillus daliensis TaxID=2892995 RepID=UPI001E47FC6A|nr:SMI1/KNR4 family protein [Brevibacillus daliensis]
MENIYKDIDIVIDKMKAALEARREQDRQYSTKYPIDVITEAEEQDILIVSDKWSLPDEYLYFLKRYVPLSVSWNTDEYINLDIFGAKDLIQGQWGYNYNPVTDEAITDWPTDYLVIASDEGNPYCIDLSKRNTVIYTAEHGTGSWDFSIAYDNLVEFLQSSLLPCTPNEWDICESEQYDYYKIFITGSGSDKIKTLVFIKKMFGCDYSQAKKYMETVPLQVYKGIASGATKVESELKRIGTDYEIRKITTDEFFKG